MAVDAIRMIEMIRTYIPDKDERVLATVSGDDASWDEVIEDIRIIKPRLNRDDAVMIYVSSHGGWNRDEDYLFYVLNEQGIKRETLRRMLDGMNCRLKILITDACASDPNQKAFKKPKKPKYYREPTRSDSKPAAPLADSLFFDAKGFVDIMSSKKGQPSLYFGPSWSNYSGGVFTYSFCSLFEKEHMRRHSWLKFFGDVQEKNAGLSKVVYLTGSGANKSTQAVILSAAHARDDMIGFTASKGRYISRVDRGSLAEKVGLRVGDDIRVIDGRLISNASDFNKAFPVDYTLPITMTIRRNGKLRNIKIDR